MKSRYFFLRFKRATEVDFCGERLSLNGRNGFKKYTLKPVNLAANDLRGHLGLVAGHVPDIEYFTESACLRYLRTNC